MSWPTLKLGRQKAEYQNSEARPCKKLRILKRNDLPMDWDEESEPPRNKNPCTTKNSLYSPSDNLMTVFVTPPPRSFPTLSKGFAWNEATGTMDGIMRIKIDDRARRYHNLPKVPTNEERLIQPSPGAADGNIAADMSKVRGEIRSFLSVLQQHVDARIGTTRDYTSDQFRRDTNIIGNFKAKKSLVDKAFLDEMSKPLSDIEEIFGDIAGKAKQMNFLRACEPFKRQGLQVVTMCSGTESPLIAMELLKEAFGDDSNLFNFKHVASAEIEPFKQAYIQRNFDPAILFRDVTEFNDANCKPHTAYGSTAKQPKDVHILIAGSSCIDYSTLNNEKKRFGEDGQSFSTMMGIAAYCLRVQPVLVILENVAGAPWPQMLDTWKAIGYTGVVFKVDSKDFYVPQTRIRGYIVAFHTEKVRARGFDLKVMLGRVTTFLFEFAQRASVPYSAFIFKDDDPELTAVRSTLDTAAEDTANASRHWTACRHRYAGHRAVMKTGFGRPLTRWMPDGSCSPFDIVWVTWMRLQRERIWDTIDIDYLQYLCQRDYDMCYKNRIIELSQNVDRDSDTKHWGIASCITPSGMPWDTRRGGPISGKEILSLQGIPTHKLNLNKETSRQLQDLAGNAMTTTVVGSVVFSAIIASMKPDALDSHGSLAENDSIFEYFPNVPDLKPDVITPAATLDKLLDQPTPNWSLEAVPLRRPAKSFELAELRKIAAQTMQLCRCEGSSLCTSSSISICRSCGHTCCSACSGNPTHNYDTLPTQFTDERKSPAAFAEYVRQEFPIAIDLTTTPDCQATLNGIRESLLNNGNSRIEDNVEHNTFFDNLLKAVSICTYTFSSVKRDKIWRVVYESDVGRLELHLMQQWLPEGETWNGEIVQCTWYLFVKPPSNVHSGSPLRKIMQQPIARMAPYENSLLSGAWLRNNLIKQIVQLMVEPLGTPTPAWEAKLGIQSPAFRDAQIYPGLRIQMNKNDSETTQPHIREAIEGSYKYLANCGGANGSLHVKDLRDDAGVHENSVEEARVRHTSGEYLFLDPEPLGNASLDSIVFAPFHERLPLEVFRPVTAKILPPWRPFLVNGEDKERRPVQCEIVDEWEELPGLHAAPSTHFSSATIYQPLLMSGFITDSHGCKEYDTVAVCDMPHLRQSAPKLKMKRAQEIHVIDQPQALPKLQWLIKPSLALQILNGWHEIHHTYGQNPRCACAPPKPLLQWSLAKAGTACIIKPFEDPKAASDYERAIRHIPGPIKIVVHCHQNQILLDAKINLSSPVHRILGSLKHENDESIKLQWRIAQDDGLESPPVFPTLRISGYSDSDPRAASAGIKKRLLNRQMQSLYWMRKREESNDRWEEWDRVEARIPAMEWRLDVEGKKTVDVRGGILADQVGAGKTITSLALASEDAAHSCNKPDQIDGRKGLISIKATLILVPKNLLGQWKDEAKKFLKPGIGVIVILDATFFKARTMHDLKQEDIILAPFELFEEDQYWEEVRNLGNTFNVPKKAGRGFCQWLGEACSDLTEMAAFAKEEDGTLSVERWNEARDRKRAEMKERYGERFGAFRQGNTKRALIARENEGYCPAHAQAIQASQKDDIDEDAALWCETSVEEIPPLLHLFQFKRIMVDEFSYLDKRQMPAIERLSARRRWMLSGTPPIDDFVSINKMANLLGTRITPRGEKDVIVSFTKVNKVAASDKTSAEEFLDQLESYSAAWIKERNERAESFVNMFMRQNKRLLPLDTKPRQHIVVSEMTPFEAYLYDKSFQHINGQPRGTETIDHVAVQDAKVIKREKGFAEAFKKHKSAVIAMMTCIALLLVKYLEDFPKVNGNTTWDEEILRDLIGEKTREFANQCRRIVNFLAEAFDNWASTGGDSSNESLGVYLQNILQHNFGDRAVTGVLLRIAQYCSSHHAAIVPADGLGRHVTTIGLPAQKQYAIDLNTLTREVTQVAQELRLLKVVAELSANQPGAQFQCIWCDNHFTPGDCEVLALCGHVSCRRCLEDAERLQANPDGCPLPGCGAPSRRSHIPATRYLGVEAREVAPWGTKMSSVAVELRRIRRKCPGERALVFVQRLEHRVLLTNMLDAQFARQFRDATSNAATGVKLFLQSSKEWILLLLVSDVSAAGWNLQACNHVLFVSPYFTRSAYGYRSTMEQAVGRAFRHGQTREVHVYHFLTYGTHEMELFQCRNGGALVEANGMWSLAEGETRRVGGEFSGPMLGERGDEGEEEEGEEGGQ